jgi:hypothetical protein
MSRQLLGCACAGVLALGTSVAAQNPPPSQPPTQPPPTQTPSARSGAQDEARVTIEGCLVREEDVPGRQPNVAERAGIAEDYILTSAKVVKGSVSSGSGQADAPTGTSGTTGASMFQVEGIDDERLKTHLGRRVQIDGTIDRARTPGGSDDLPEIRATTVRAASGDCPSSEKK